MGLLAEFAIDGVLHIDARILGAIGGSVSPYRKAVRLRTRSTSSMIVSGVVSMKLPSTTMIFPVRLCGKRFI